MKKLSLSLMLLLPALSLCAQAFVAGFMTRDYQYGLNQDVQVAIITLTMDAPVPSIVIDWGDGQQEVLAAEPNDQAGPYYGNIYQAWHQYEAFGTYTISYVDSFWVSDIVNLPDAGSQLFRLEEEVRVLDTVYTGRPPIFFTISDPVGLEFEESGALNYSFVYYGFDVSLAALRFRDFPGEGYSFPEATDSLSCCIFWDRPLAAGRYAFAVEAFIEGIGAEVGTSTMLVALEVPEVSSSGEEVKGGGLLRLYPNPFQNTLHLSLPEVSAGPARVAVFSAAGQRVYETELPKGGPLQTLELGQLPPGFYFLEWRQGPYRQTAKIVKQ